MQGTRRNEVIHESSSNSDQGSNIPIHEVNLRVTTEF